MGETAIEVRNIGKSYQIYARPIDRLKQSLWRNKKRFYREFWALRDVSLRVERGETLGIVGSNGSGKTTFLQLVCGILSPTKGSLSVKGRIAGLLELGAGFNPEFTGRENVFMNGAVMGLSRREIEAVYGEIEEFANIGEFIDQPVKVYSSGMYLRLAFAAAVHVAPDILVIDEALSVGDARFQQKCMAKIRAFCDKGTVLFVTHNSNSVVELCSRAVWIENGEVRMDDSPKLVVEKYLQFMYEGENAFSDEKQAAAVKEVENAVDESQFARIEDDLRQFGDYRARIKGVRLASGGRNNSLVFSDRPCEVSILVRAEDTIRCPIIGFMVKDRLGRQVLADNTAFLQCETPVLEAGRDYVASFSIGLWPNLREDEYTLTVAVADGDVEEHSQCHYVNDGVVFKSVPVRKPPALFSVPDTTFSCKRIG